MAFTPPALPYNIGDTTTDTDGIEYVYTESGWTSAASGRIVLQWSGRVRLYDTTWTGFDQNRGPNDAELDRNYGNATIPNMARNFTGFIVPTHGSVVGVRISFRASSGETNSMKFRLMAQTKVDDSNTVTNKEVGAEQTFSCDSTRNRMIEWTFADTVTKGDILSPMFWREVGGAVDPYRLNGCMIEIELDTTKI